MRFALILFAALALGSCATLSEEECRAGDWRGIGIEDGQRGRAADFIDRHREACAKVGVTPDIAAWAAGRQLGLQSYCTPENAYDIGRNGRILNTVCPLTSLATLQAANRKGLTYHRIGQDIADLERHAREVRAQLATLGPDDIGLRAALLGELSSIRLRIISLETERMLYARL